MLWKDTENPLGCKYRAEVFLSAAQRSGGSGMATEQWRGQAVHSHFMTQTNQGQDIQVATWGGHELQHKLIVLTNQLWSIKPNKMHCIT